MKKTVTELIQALEKCMLGTSCACEGCPYEEDEVDCPQGLHGDILVVLKEIQNEKESKQ